ncbi:hypothetical protein LSTR_LSTR002403 [Laodelphax striatellus]|uniref:ditrans,polycis-polyprenyl diphosphate synthase [(2E,6E)-farnesyldiphosphate specific] n=1 Tax=Laodelphax striatellus TaxID=195883 RepID=A0A482X3N7_LAOST|nr:hypothetical protein LSTR_LSTR002403 [Laodelphax striatellus]
MVSVVLDKCLLNIGIFILNIIHYLYSVFAFINGVINDFLLKTRTLCIWLGLSPKQTFNTPSAEYISSLRKIPRHLVIIIGCESVVYRNLVKIVLWCNQLGIKHVSFYEQNDDIDPLKLYEAICRQNKENLKIIRWGRSFDLIREQAKRDINGYTWKPQLQVDVFRIDDGHQLVADAAQELCGGHVASTLVTQPYLEDVLMKRIDAPDPDLAIICGAACSSRGFPPWQLRITEFLHLQSHHKIKFKNFVSLLQRYSNCEQRFGEMNSTSVMLMVLVISAALDNYFKANAMDYLEFRCQAICQTTDTDHQCNHCRSRLPIRFGKRNKIQFQLRTSSPYQQSAPCCSDVPRLLTLLLQHASNLVQKSFPNNQRQDGLQFQLEYK